MNETIKAKLTDADLVIYEPVELRSGEVSEYYVDVKKGYGDPELLKSIASEIAKVIPENVTCIAASGYGGISLGTALSLELSKHLTLVRDTEKEHGTGGSIDGYIPGEQDTVAIVDDVFTSGSSLRQTIESLRSLNTNIQGCYVVVKRGDGELPVELNYLIDAKELTEE